MRISRRDNSRYALVKVLITVLALAGVSFGTALVWQNAQDAIIGAEAAALKANPASLGNDVENPVPNSERVYDAEPSAADVAFEQEPVQIETVSDSGAESASEESGPEDGEALTQASYARKAMEGSVPEAPAVGYSYFDDAIFFGDSISTGIPLYMQTLVPDAAVIAVQGVSTVSVSTSECIDINGTRVTMLDAAKTKGERKKVYIMLGANGLDYDEAPFIDGYREFVRSVKSLYPDAVIYLQSMLPVTSGVNARYKSPNINNTRIFDLNGAILRMAAEEGVYYVDVAQCMVNAEGFLPTEASPFDGMHLTAEYYVRWFDYLRTHTVDLKTKKGMTK